MLSVSECGNGVRQCGYRQTVNKGMVEWMNECNREWKKENRQKEQEKCIKEKYERKTV